MMWGVVARVDEYGVVRDVYTGIIVVVNRSADLHPRATVMTGIPNLAGRAAGVGIKKSFFKRKALLFFLMPKKPRKLKRKAKFLKKKGLSREKRRLVLLGKALKKYCREENLSGKLKENILELAYEDMNVRWRAAWSLGDLKDRKAVNPLINSLKDPEARVRQWAAVSLGVLAFSLVSGENLKKLEVAEKFFHEVSKEKKALLLLAIALKPRLQGQCPANIEYRKGRNYLNLLKKQAGMYSIEEIVKILELSEKKGKKIKRGKDYN